MNPSYAAVAARAQHRCKYCRAPEVVFNFPFEVEHIMPRSQQGGDELENLALACRSCNLRKGMRASGFVPDSDTEIRFFHPRRDRWSEHFQAETNSGQIVGKTLIGEVTANYLAINSPTQIAARQLWMRLGLFP